METLYKNIGKSLFWACLIAGPMTVFSQGVVNNGAKINISNSAYFNIDNGGFTNLTNGQVTNTGTMQVEGDWSNSDPGGVFTVSPTTGIVELDGGLQNIGGAVETNFYNLVIKGTDKKTLSLSGSTPLPNGVRVVNDLFLNNQHLSLNSRTLTVENSAVAAIHGGGKLISETGKAQGGYGVVKWLTPTLLASYPRTYSVPFGTNAATPADVGFQYNIVNPGTPTTYYKTFATYGTDNANSFDEIGNPDIATGPFATTEWSNLPYSVNHLTDGYIQASHKWVIDRFWIIDEINLGNGDNPAIAAGGGYGSRPLIEYTFKYTNTEWGGTNLITPSLLTPQRYNHGDNAWGDWLYSDPTFTNDWSNNRLTMTIGATDPGGNNDSWLEDMYPVWTLVDASDPLPIELVRFAGECADEKIEVRWTTWTETNNDFFTLERSNNGTDFEVVDVIAGAGNSNQSISYNVTDNMPYGGTSYYRLKNTDFSGNVKYSEIIAVTCGTDGNEFDFVNAYESDMTELVVEFTAAENEDFTVKLFDASGRIILSHGGSAYDGLNKLRLNSGDLARGIYIINLSNGVRNYSKRVMLR